MLDCDELTNSFAEDSSFPFQDRTNVSSRGTFRSEDPSFLGVSSDQLMSLSMLDHEIGRGTGDDRVYRNSCQGRQTMNLHTVFTHHTLSRRVRPRPGNIKKNDPLVGCRAGVSCSPTNRVPM